MDYRGYTYMGSLRGRVCADVNLKGSWPSSVARTTYAKGLDAVVTNVAKKEE